MLISLSFVSTSNETEVTELMKEAMSINLIDAEESVAPLRAR